MATFPASVRVSVRVAAHQPKGLLQTGRLRSGCLAHGATAFLAASAARCLGASCAQKPSAAEMLKSKVAKGMKRRDMQMLQMDAPDAIAEFQSLKEDPLASWSLLGDQDFQVRVFTVLLLAFLPCAFLASSASTEHHGRRLFWLQRGCFVSHVPPPTHWLLPSESESIAPSAQCLFGNWWWRIFSANEECCQPTLASFAWQYFCMSLLMDVASA